MHATSVGKAGLPQNSSEKQAIAKRVEELSRGSKYWQKNEQKLKEQTEDNKQSKHQLNLLLKNESMVKQAEKRCEDLRKAAEHQLEALVYLTR